MKMNDNVLKDHPVFSDPVRSKSYFKNVEYFKNMYKKLGPSEASRRAVIRAQQVDLTEYGPNWFNTSTAQEKKERAQKIYGGKK